MREATVVFTGESSGRREPSRRGAERGGKSPAEARVSSLLSVAGAGSR